MAVISESDNRHGEYLRRLGRVITQLNRMRKRYMSEHLSQYGLSGSTYMILTALEKTPGACQDDLCEKFCMDKGNIARSAKRLVELGYIRRETDPRDRRQYKLYLTESGQALVPVICGMLRDWSNIMSAGLIDEECETVLGLLERMMNNSTDFFKI